MARQASLRHRYHTTTASANTLFPESNSLDEHKLEVECQTPALPRAGHGRDYPGDEEAEDDNENDEDGEDEDEDEGEDEEEETDWRLAALIGTGDGGGLVEDDPVGGNNTGTAGAIGKDNFSATKDNYDDNTSANTTTAMHTGIKVGGSDSTSVDDGAGHIAEIGRAHV